MSYTFYAGAFDEDGCFSPVIPFAHHDPFIYPDDPDDEKLLNPEYVAHASLNLANGNAYRVMERLGYFETAPIEIDAFIEVTEVWLRNFGERASRAIPDKVTVGPGATVINCGVDEGYFNDRIGELLNIARTGKARGATHMIAA